jgi:membrane protein required for beta-lactamase induction
MQATDAGAQDSTDSTTEQRRELAIKRLKAKSDFKKHLLAYVAVNTMLIVIWAFNSAGQPWPRGMFWPIIPIVGWGVGLVMQGYVTYRGNVYTQEKIQREMSKLP